MMDVTEDPVIDTVIAPPLAPADRPIDVDHLSRMTLGDRDLERDVLQLFGRQLDMLMARIEKADPAVAAAAAHTLKGSATGVGAWALAQAAAQIEALAKSRDMVKRRARIQTLRRAIRETQAEITELLRAAA